MANVTNSFWHNKRVLVTGHTGFKGAWLCIWLKQLGAKVMGYALQPSTSPNLYEASKLSELLDFNIIDDILNQDALNNCLQVFKPEIVFHLAAKALVKESYINPIETFSINVMGTAYLLECLRYIKEVRSILIITSDKCYYNEEKQYKFKEDDKLGGKDPYSSSKACQEHITEAYRDSYYRKDLELKTGIATARGGNVIGGGDWSQDRLIPDLIKSVVENKEITLRNPNSIRPWQHVLDCLSGYLKLSQRLFEHPTKFSSAFNFSSQDDETVSVICLLTKLSQLMDKEIKFNIASNDNFSEHQYLQLNSNKSLIELEWQSKLKLDENLKLTFEWYKNFYQGEDAYQLCLKDLEIYSFHG